MHKETHSISRKSRKRKIEMKKEERNKQKSYLGRPTPVQGSRAHLFHPTTFSLASSPLSISSSLSLPATPSSTPATHPSYHIPLTPTTPPILFPRCQPPYPPYSLYAGHPNYPIPSIPSPAHASIRETLEPRLLHRRRGPPGPRWGHRTELGLLVLRFSSA
jgi:hypothetical protein